MKTTTAWRAGSASDTGLQRGTNEDRLLVDVARGLFLVVDGLGGHAAGETAAEAAVQTISRELESGTSDTEKAVRRAITEANNRIFFLAQGNPAWRGMACVLTLAVLQDDRVVVGHVGDSRLYLLWNGRLRKLTSDHSPVGEQEDGGTLDEETAMRHPRRNEVLRDVGSVPREVDDPNFAELRSFAFRPDAALLLCSDGLSDMLTSAEMIAILSGYDGDENKTAGQLVAAANERGGADNVSVIFVAGPEFAGATSNPLAEVRPRHSITRVRPEGRRWRPGRNIYWLLIGIVLGILIASAFERRAELATAVGHWLPGRSMSGKQKQKQ